MPGSGIDSSRRDIADLAACERACEGVDLVLHQAALGSVPRSIEDPLRTHAANATGFLNLLCAARDAGRRTLRLRRVELHLRGPSRACRKSRTTSAGRSRRMRSRSTSTSSMPTCSAAATARPPSGLRYFNVFGPRQDPEGAYAAVVPRWVATMLRGETIRINGDGETTRDFCYIANVVQANMLAATAGDAVSGEVFNVAVGGRMSLNELARTLREAIEQRHPGVVVPPPVHGEPRAGDVRHSQADIGKARTLLGYAPTHDARAGLREALPWYERDVGGIAAAVAEEHVDAAAR